MHGSEGTLTIKTKLEAAGAVVEVK